METIKFSLPEHWEDWCSWLLGIWLCISPWAAGFDLDSTGTRIAVISGLLVIMADLVTLSVFRPWEEWLNILIGAWLVICPWILGISTSAATTNFIVVGVLVIALALYEIFDANGQIEK